ncbi:proteasome subunit alpha type 4 putative [Entamoeba histolytica]|uniref:Proteasome subunit alpha type n=8 Tax=Entamoeba TaxID=5758 RepID=C4M7Z3_ENTH1|nr:proteasome alpha subunit, putative [Entamoeba histolytica HM-1:IMSS]EAL50177.1 proteasome alpha subunit, putative [Entamoeba histolytica HM-1:IMSS]EMD42919.1 proteasome alpha subunit, putative [Entamoeba histolytica KU27]GAT97684.1 proteasome subunit alpha type 4 putative [Entamoeba histolytica]|eukprot:XP_655561.1 proteasome alpha subunit, putative [Entamoeba histolytica HM-1:IMSS]
MARRYDSRTTMFSPEGRLYQVEYAMEAISHSSSAIGILATDGILLAAKKKRVARLVDRSKGADKMYELDEHIACAAAGITSDTNILVDYLRDVCQQHRFTYGEEIPVEMLVQRICDMKQSYTQYGGLRPYGVSFLYAGWDRYFGYQLYMCDPSGNYGGWKATAIGANYQAAESIMKAEYKDDITLEEAKKLAVKIFSKSVESSSMVPSKLEFGIFKLDNQNKPSFKVMKDREVSVLLKECGIEQVEDRD